MYKNKVIFYIKIKISLSYGGSTSKNTNNVGIYYWSNVTHLKKINGDQTSL